MQALTDEQAALVEAVGRFLAKESSPERVRDTERVGFDRKVWDGLVDMGLVAMAVAEDAGGGGARLADAALVAEQCGAHLAAAPFVEATVAARLIADASQRIVVFAPRPAVDGVAPLVPGGAIASAVVALDGDRLVLVELAESPPHVANLGGLPLADVDMRGGQILASGPEAITRYEVAQDEWRILTAATLAGLARAALALGIEYVKERHQFGQPIGAFQTIQHRLADVHTAVDGALLFAHAAAEDPSPVNAAMAYAWCGETAEQSALASLHFHGGYGFMLEYDVQLFVKRAKGLRLALGDPRAERQRIARLKWGGEHRPSIDYALDDATDAFRREVRSFIAERLTREIVERSRSTGTMHDWAFHAALCERGYLAAGWPEDVGGLGRTPIETTTLFQELYYAGAPVDGMGIAAMVGATLLLQGSNEQRSTILPRILNGEVICCLGYSEPDAGSDVAAVQTRAVRDGDSWVINGQKMFTTMAHEAHYVFLLTRTNLGVPKHKSLTMFLVPMDTPGIELTPVETLGGERTNITFYTDVHVPDSCRVGDVDAGWSVMHAALVYERNSANWGEPARFVDDVAAWAATAGPDGARPLDDPVVADRLVPHAIRMEVGRLLLYRTAWLAAKGGLPQVEGSMAKLFITEAFTAAAADLLDLVGAEGVRTGEFEHTYRHATVTTIYGGSSEVQRGIIAERGLGLPRSRG